MGSRDDPLDFGVDLPLSMRCEGWRGGERGWRVGRRMDAEFFLKNVAIALFRCTVLNPMPKPVARRKTKKAVAKRFKVTASGKLLRRKPGLRHLASSKSSKRKRKLGKAALVHETMEPRMKECLPFA